MANEQSGIKPDRVEEHAQLMFVAGLSEEYPFGEPMNPSGQWQELGRYLGRIPGQKGNIAYGICFDMEDGTGIKYLCGVEVSGDVTDSELPDRFELRQLPAFTYAVFKHNGHVTEIPQTCDVIWKEWIPISGCSKPDGANFFFERYGDGFDPQKGIGDIEIWVPVEY